VVKVRLNKYLKFSIKVVVSAAALIYVFSRINFNEILNVYRNIHFIWLFIALVVFILSKIISAFRLNLFFKEIELILKHSYNLKLYLLGMFYNLFLPGGIGGDGYKIYLLNKNHEIKTGKIIWAILNDRLTGLVSIICLLALLSYGVVFQSEFSVRSFAWLLIPVSLLSYYIFITFFFKVYRRIFIKVNVMALIIQMLQIVCAGFIFYSLGYRDQLASYIFLFLISSIIAALPVTVGGMGSRELTFMIGAEMMGLNVEISVAMSLMFYIITAFTSMFGIWYNLYPQKMNR